MYVCTSLWPSYDLPPALLGISSCKCQSSAHMGCDDLRSQKNVSRTGYFRVDDDDGGGGARYLFLAKLGGGRRHAQWVMIKDI